MTNKGYIYSFKQLWFCEFPRVLILFPKLVLYVQGIQKFISFFSLTRDLKDFLIFCRWHFVWSYKASVQFFPDIFIQLGIILCRQIMAFRSFQRNLHPKINTGNFNVLKNCLSSLYSLLKSLSLVIKATGLINHKRTISKITQHTL